MHFVRKKLDDPRYCVATIDCSNAFNRIARKSILAQLRGPFSGMLGYFRFAYGKESRLLFKKKDGTWAHIPSSRGGKQGDTAMPAFFALGMHPAIEGLATEDLFPKGFLDDISVVGLPDQVLNAVRVIEERLHHLGLELNRSKCEVYGTEAEQVAAALGFLWAKDGIKILGAWITRDNPESTRKYLKKQLEKHKLMLKKLVELPPDIAFPLLSSCGVPRWNFLARTHDPGSMLEATKEFDKAVLETFCEIAGVDSENLSYEQLMLIHLPTSKGGMGITCYETILACAYEASANPDGDAQDARTTMINEQIIEELKKKKGLASHLELCAGRHASCWLSAAEVVCKDPSGFKGALQQRIRYVPKTKKTLVHCVCGFPGKPEEIEKHAAGCKGEKSNNLTARHEAVQQVLVEIARESGVPVTIAPTCGGKKRGDVELHLPSGDVVIDFTVCYESAPSYAKKAPGQLEREKNNKKQHHYKEGLGGRELKTFFLDTLGGWSNTAIGVIASLVENSTVTKQGAIRRITKEAMCRTGSMILKTRLCYSAKAPREDEHNKENTNKSTLAKSNLADPSPAGMCRIFSTDTPAAAQTKQRTSVCRTPLQDIAGQSASRQAAGAGLTSHLGTPAPHTPQHQQANVADVDSDEMRRIAAESPMQEPAGSILHFESPGAPVERQPALSE